MYRSLPLLRGGLWLAAAAALSVSTGCSEGSSAPSGDTEHPSLAAAPAPGGLVTIAGTDVRLWPFIAWDLQNAHDPLSLLVTSEGDPRRIRAALLSLNGNRTGLPAPFDALAMFDCTWTDGIGDEYAGYVVGLGWTASAIQLECGSFGPAPRFHVRLFDAGGAVLIGAHFEIQIPGTHNHEVLNFDIAKALVAADLLRAGVTGLPVPTGTAIASIARPITSEVYGGLVNDPQIGPLIPLLTGGPDKDTWNAANPKPTVLAPNDGYPLIATALLHFPSLGSGTSQSFTIEFNQLIPKPFCAATEQAVHGEGALHFSKRVTVQPDGRQVSEIRVDGELTVTPVLPPGQPYRAQVGEFHRTWLTADAHSVLWQQQQILLPARTADRGNYRLNFHVASSGPAKFKVLERCGGSAP